MKLNEALKILNKIVKCQDNDACDEYCLNCEYSMSADDMQEAVKIAISALEFRTRYDQFWEEVKAAGVRGEEVEIHHSGRVFKIREVAQ